MNIDLQRRAVQGLRVKGTALFLVACNNFSLQFCCCLATKSFFFLSLNSDSFVNNPYCRDICKLGSFKEAYFPTHFFPCRLLSSSYFSPLTLPLMAAASSPWQWQRQRL